MQFPSRRFFLAGSLAGLSGLAGCNGRETLSALPLDKDSRVDNVRSYLKTISDLSGRPTYRYHTGTILAVPKPKHLGEPFVKFHAVKQDRVRELPDGTFQHAYRGIILFTDPNTDEVLETFANPLTGVTNDVKHYKTSRGSIVYAPKGVYFLRAGGSPSGLKPEGEDPFRVRWSGVGDDVWMTYDERFKIDDAEGNLLFADNSMYRYRTKMSELTNPSVTSSSMTMTWATETTFWEWMDMKDHPGHLIFGSMGQKFLDKSLLPARILAAAEQYLPAHLHDPIKWDDHAIQNL